MTHFVIDLRHALRLLRQNPGFTAITLLALAVGIGANTAIFSVVNAVLLRSLPYAQADRLVVALDRGTNPVAPANYLDWRNSARSFESMGAAEAWGPSLSGKDRSELIPGLHVSANMFSLLGVAPMLGRTFELNEDKPEAARVIVLSHQFWEKRLASDANALGRTLTLDGEPYTVVGVMPPHFQFAPFWITTAEFWAPLTLGPRVADRSGQSLRVFARLSPNASVEQAQAEMDVIGRQLAERFPNTNRGVNTRIVPLREKVVGNIRPTLIVLMGTVSFVLLIACSNVANLMLARVTARRRELAVRSALGANRGRLLSQILTESALLSVLGGICGLLLATWGVHLLAATLPEGRLPRQDQLGMDRVTMLFTFAVSLLAGILSGLAPAWNSSALDPQETLKEGGRGPSAAGVRKTAARVLVATQTALALALLVGAGLMIRSFLSIQAIDPGFEPDHVLALTISVVGTAEAAEGPRAVFYEEVAQRLSALPGVTAVGTINHLPIGGDQWGFQFRLADRPEPAPGETPSAVYRVVRPGYFHAMRIPVRDGRDFTRDDRADAPGAVVVNEALAHRYWPGHSPIGQRLSLSSPGQPAHWLTITGLVANVRQADWTSEPGNEIYLPLAQTADYLANPGAHFSYVTYVIRTAGDPAALTSAARSAIWSIDRAVPVSQVNTMNEVVANSLWRERVSTLLLGLFAAAALILAITGIYGVVTQAVAQRKPEIAIRMALGARPASVLYLTIKDGMLPVFAGIAAGWALALAGSRLLSSLLYGVRPSDPLTFAAVGVLLALAALLANYLPARRASRQDPTEALR